MKKYVDKFWDFKGVNTKEFTHGYHTYPAIMIPQIARELIKKYSNEKTKLIFDPYMGSGTTLVEAKLKGIDAIGTDLNPLARLIGKSKTNLIDIDELENEIIKFEKIILKIMENILEYEVEIPYFSIRDSWFKIKILKDLAILKENIKKITNLEIQEFFLVAFSEIVRKVSLTRNSEFKLYKIEESKREEFNPDTIALFFQKILENFRNYVDFYNELKKTDKISSTKIYDFNTTYGIPEALIRDESIDLVVTSPPYGDSKTTVAYGQFSRLANEWLGYTEAIKVDSKLMGGEKTQKLEKLGYEPLDKILEKIKVNDDQKNIEKKGKSKRALEVLSFYSEYKKSINNISKKIKKGGVVVYVVGNRRVCDIELPTDEVTKYFFEQNNFIHKETIIRDIPNKRMPSKTSPTNESGKKVKTMTNEYIVVMEKI